MININIVAIQRTVRWLCPSMKEKGQGWVININSTNGLHPSAGTPACAHIRHQKCAPTRAQLCIVCSLPGLAGRHALELRSCMLQTAARSGVPGDGGEAELLLLACDCCCQASS